MNDLESSKPNANDQEQLSEQEMMRSFMELQRKELEVKQSELGLRTKELDLKSQELDGNKVLAEKSIEAQSADNDKERDHKKSMGRLALVGLTVLLIFFYFVIMQGSEGFALVRDVFGIGVGVIVGGLGGYNWGYRKGKSD